MMDFPEVLILFTAEKYSAKKVLIFIRNKFDEGAQLVMPEATGSEIGLQGMGALRPWHVIQVTNEHAAKSIETNGEFDVLRFPDQMFGRGTVVVLPPYSSMLNDTSIRVKITERSGVKINSHGNDVALEGRWFQLQRAHQMLAAYNFESAQKASRAASAALHSGPKSLPSHSFTQQTALLSIARSNSVDDSLQGNHRQGVTVHSAGKSAKYTSDKEFDEGDHSPPKQSHGGPMSLPVGMSTRQPSGKAVDTNIEDDTPGNMLVESSSTGNDGRKGGSAGTKSKKVTGSKAKDPHSKSEKESKRCTKPANADSDEEELNKIAADMSDISKKSTVTKPQSSSGVKRGKAQIQIIPLTRWMYAYRLCAQELNKIKKRYDVDIVTEDSEKGTDIEIYILFSDQCDTVKAKDELIDLFKSCDHNGESLLLHHSIDLKLFKTKNPGIVFGISHNRDVIAVGRYDDIDKLKCDVRKTAPHYLLSVSSDNVTGCGGGRSASGHAHSDDNDVEMRNDERKSRSSPSHSNHGNYGGDTTRNKMDEESESTYDKNSRGMSNHKSLSSPNMWGQSETSQGASGESTYGQGASNHGTQGRSNRNNHGGNFYHHKNGQSVFIHKDDITKMSVDVIVNATGSQLENYGGVSRAISTAAGYTFEKECKDIIKRRSYQSIQPGEVVSTGAGDLKCKQVLHTVGPQWRLAGITYDGKQKAKSKLIMSVETCLFQAASAGATSIAIPAIGSGVHGVPVDVVAECFYNATKKFCCKPSRLSEIHFVDIQSNVVQAIDKEFKKSNVFSEGDNPSVGGYDDQRAHRSAGGMSTRASPGGASYAQAASSTGHKSTRSPDRSSPATRVSPDRSGASGSQPNTDDCAICMDTPKKPKKLMKCGHIFCSDCIKKSFAMKPVCPICGAVYGEITGTQPVNGQMSHRKNYMRLEGYKNCDTIEIIYYFPPGTQTGEHPNPGKRYAGISRTAYLPDNREGRHVLSLLEKAFKARLTFTIGRSTTTGMDDQITWNDIHHKTSMYGGASSFGYPDPTYLKRVQDELAAKGIN